MRASQKRALAFFALAALLTAPLMAQVATGELTGRVQDEDRAPLPGITITATSPQLQGQRSAVSDGNGNYKLPFLPAGDYRVTYELEGFATGVRRVNINAGQGTRSDPVTMQLATVEEEIIVTGELETISKGLTGAATVEQFEVEMLAVPRTLRESAMLAPGVHTTSLGTVENPRVTISGAVSSENLFLMNGVVMNENLRGQAFDLFIEDAIQETTVSASGISAEYGRFTGGVVNAVTKSGSNQFGGSVRVNFANDDWIARNDLSPDRKDDVTETLEATLGGYIMKDRLWFFGAGRDTETSENQSTRAVTNIPFDRVDTGASFLSREHDLTELEVVGFNVEFDDYDSRSELLDAKWSLSGGQNSFRLSERFGDLWLRALEVGFRPTSVTDSSWGRIKSSFAH